MNSRKILYVALLGILPALGTLGWSQTPSASDGRESARKQQSAGNFKDAYESFATLARSADDDPTKVGDDLQAAIDCLQALGRTNEIDSLREEVVAMHSDNWRLLASAAEGLQRTDPHGYLIAGKFERGGHRGGGRVVNAAQRDRVRALQLMRDAHSKFPDDILPQERARFYLAWSDMLLPREGAAGSWRLQSLTDLETLPDYEEGWRRGFDATGAPVVAEGNPVYYSAPRAWDEAQNDGQRWRWTLTQAAEAAPAFAPEATLRLADFLRGQFGVQTLAAVGWPWGGTFDGDQNPSSTYALHTLADDETVARLATGVKRFKLPEEFNFIKLYEQVGAGPKSTLAERALQSLAEGFENRRQYPRAAEYWQRLVKDYATGRVERKARFDQITGNWGRFEPVMGQPAGTGATVDYRYRNGRKVTFVAREIRVAKLLNDVKQYLKSSPAELDWQKLSIDNLGYRLVTENQGDYVGGVVAQWSLDLEPRANHFDRRTTISTPLQKAGAYLLTAQLENGNESNIVLWLSDAALVKKPLVDKTLYYLADAKTGAPIPKANLEFFGYRQRQVQQRPRYMVDVKNFAELTNGDGQVIAGNDRLSHEYTWLITARAPDGRFAWLGFTGVWYSGAQDLSYNEVKSLVITDRPVYRPQQPVQFKTWIRRAQYDEAEVSEFAGRSFQVRIHDPRGNKVLEQNYTADAYGGVLGKLDLPADAALGQYLIEVVNYGGGQFRVEEYKKPEFEVTIDAPTKPISLGDKIKAKLTARYYFGSPVSQARAKIKVVRSAYSERWFPVGRWDWLYGPGYWWFAYDSAWYPGWRDWGCRRPSPWWWGTPHQPPEVVLEREVSLNADGTLEIEIDTALAKELHSDQDHRYEITAEVTDASRRVIVGQGKVLVSRKPFQVFAWVDRGHYRVGDVVDASFAAHTLDQRPVQGKGQLRLLQVNYDDQARPQETLVREWELDTNDQGQASLKIQASAAGQYRLSYRLTDAEEHTLEGGYMFTVMGDGNDGADFRFGALELIPDKKEYRPGETVNLQINTNRIGSTVLLFVRPTNGVAPAPKMLRLTGKTTIEPIAVVQKDMPNFFVEAITVADGRVVNETRDIVVPPESRVLQVQVKPSSGNYKPGEKAKVQLEVRGPDGKPFVGSLVASIYDKSVEYISGGSNVPEIKEFFWKWRRSHHPGYESSLERGSDNVTKQNVPTMNDLGVFGHEMADTGVMRFRRASALGTVMNRMTPLSAAAAPMAEFASDQLSAAQPSGPSPAPVVEPTVRTQFADTAFWAGELKTNSDGLADVFLDMPENLTTWKIKTWAMGHGTKVGQGEAEVVTRKDLIVRLQAPRFFVEKDEVVLSANVHNYLKTSKHVQVVLELDGKTVEALEPAERTVEVAAGGEARVDWRVKAIGEGPITVRMKALTDEESDAMQLTFPVYVHGMLKLEALAGTVRPDETSQSFVFRVPEQRRPEQTRLEIRYSPTLAGALVDALPYLVDYPYGCTEQTLNRFLPTIITHKVLLDLGLDLKTIREKRNNLNAQELGDPAERAAGWKRGDRNPVFDEAEVQRMTRAGVERLIEMQLSDGGWGWFSGFGERSSPHTTAYVVHGLQVAQRNDVAVPPEVIERGVAWLAGYQAQQQKQLENAPSKTQPYKTSADDIDAFVTMVLVDSGNNNPVMRDFLYRDRTRLSVYAKAMFGLALHAQDETEQRDMILSNIRQFEVQDAENETAYLKLPADNPWWCWYGSEIEAQAYYLKLLAKVDPRGQTAPRLVKYLLNNRKHSNYWNSTRDTGLAIEALADYLKASGEAKPNLAVEVWIDGQKRQEVQITPENLFQFDASFVLTGDAVAAGERKIELRKSGTGPLYYNAYLTNFTLEDPIKKAGLEIKVERKVYRLDRVNADAQVAGQRGQVVNQNVEKYARHELGPDEPVKSGDLLEIELTIESKNDYEYLIFEDYKAAGCEPVEVQSGYNGNDLGAYVEFRDERVAFFKQNLARGRHSVSYRLRAEIPGKFSALPAKGWAMYAPELKANSDENKIQITD